MITNTMQVFLMVLMCSCDAEQEEKIGNLRYSVKNQSVESSASSIGLEEDTTSFEYLVSLFTQPKNEIPQALAKKYLQIQDEEFSAHTRVSKTLFQGKIIVLNYRVWVNKRYESYLSTFKNSGELITVKNLYSAEHDFRYGHTDVQFMENNMLKVEYIRDEHVFYSVPQGDGEPHRGEERILKHVVKSDFYTITSSGGIEPKEWLID